MKKNHNWNVKLLIKLDSRTKAVEIQCSVHTNIHALKIQICKQLKLMPLQTCLDIFTQKHHPLKPISTLLQNDIRVDTVLLVRVQNQSIQKKGILQSKGNGQVFQRGLSVKFHCKNQKCVNFKRQSVESLGLGQFDIKESISKIQCQVCPYRSQNIKYAIMCKQILIKDCLYEITTIEHIEEQIFKQRKSKWIKCISVKNLDEELTLGQKELGKLIKIKSI